jgi:hypothetical protein
MLRPSVLERHGVAGHIAAAARNPRQLAVNHQWGTWGSQDSEVWPGLSAGYSTPSRVAPDTRTSRFSTSTATDRFLATAQLDCSTLDGDLSMPAGLGILIATRAGCSRDLQPLPVVRPL